MISGTLLLVVGMLLCAHVVDSASREEFWKPGGGKKAYVIWLQQCGIVNDQIFESWAIYPAVQRTVITSSRSVRDEDEGMPPALQVKAAVATVAALLGFLMQFVGLRALHWSVSLVQLGAIIIMSGLRAIVRRELGKLPERRLLPFGFELEWFTETFGDEKACWRSRSREDSKSRDMRWAVVVAMASDQPARPGGGSEESGDEAHKALQEGGRPKETGGEEYTAHKALQVRSRLGRLSRWWRPASAEAGVLARAIRHTMEVMSDLLQASVYTWSLKTHYNGNGQSKEIHFVLHKKKRPIRAELETGLEASLEAAREADLEADLDAALSLWLYSVTKREQGQSQPPKGKAQSPGSAGRGLLFLGRNSPILREDLQHWIPPGEAQIMEATKAENNSNGVQRFESRRVVGYSEQSYLAEDTQYWKLQPSRLDLDSEGEMKGDYLVTDSNEPLKSLYARAMFSAFMLAVAKALNNDTGANIGPGGPKNTHAAWKDRLAMIAQGIQGAELGSLRQTYLSIIPPLSTHLKLPFAVSLPQQSPDPQVWSRQVRAMLPQLEETVKASIHKSDNGVKALTALIELSQMVHKRIEAWEEFKYGGREINDLRLLKQKIIKTVELRVELSSDLQKLYNKQRVWERDSEQVSLLTNDEELSLLSEDEELWLGSDGRYLYDWTLLHYAASRGHAEKVRKNDTDTDAQDFAGRTPLHYACQRGRFEIVWTLLDNGANLHQQDKDGTTPLHCAATEGYLKVVSLLLNRGADAASKDALGRTPLHCGASNGHVKVVRHLVKWGADATIEDVSGRTPLHHAAFAGHKELVHYLSELSRSGWFNRQGMTPLHWAVMARDPTQEVVKHLVEPKPSDESRSNEESKSNVKATDFFLRTPLHIAAERGHRDIAEMLLENGASKEAADALGRTPMHTAAGGEHGGISEVLMYEVRKGKNRPEYFEAIVRNSLKIPKTEEEQEQEKRANNETQLRDDIRQRRANVIKMLIAKDANIEAKNKAGDGTPLHHAAWGGNVDAVEALLPKDPEDPKTPPRRADVNAKALDGWTALHLAVRGRHLSVVKTLCSLKADVNARDREGRTPLDLAKGFPKPDQAIVEELRKATDTGRSSPTAGP
jgi:ankyrin repeat protein